MITQGLRENRGAGEGEASYKVLRLSTTLDLAPNPAAWEAVQRIVAKINPKIAQVDLDSILDSSFVRNLEASGFLAEQRKKVLLQLEWKSLKAWHPPLR